MMMILSVPHFEINTDSNGQMKTVYIVKIEIQFEDKESSDNQQNNRKTYCLHKRYSEFYTLYSALNDRHNKLFLNYRFPSKSMAYEDRSTFEKRRAKFDELLRIVQKITPVSSMVKNFLDFDTHITLFEKSQEISKFAPQQEQINNPANTSISVDFKEAIHFLKPSTELSQADKENINSNTQKELPRVIRGTFIFCILVYIAFVLLEIVDVEFHPPQKTVTSSVYGFLKGLYNHPWGRGSVFVLAFGCGLSFLRISLIRRESALQLLDDRRQPNHVSH